MVSRGDDFELDKDAVYRQAVRFESLGPKSDRFLTLLTSGYGVASDCNQMAKKADFTCIVLEGGIQLPVVDTAKCKLFFDVKLTQDGNDEDYCEAYLNLDLGTRLIELAEKDRDYRVNLIRALSEPQPRKGRRIE